MNVELANEALELATVHRDRFNMGVWFNSPTNKAIIDADNRAPACGTVGCYAGFITFMTAPEGTVITSDGMLYESVADAVHDEDPNAWLDEPRYWDDVETYAAGQLGITSEQADILFYVETLEEVKRLVAHLAENPDASAVELADLRDHASLVPAGTEF